MAILGGSSFKEAFRKVEAKEGFDPIPAGEYVVKVEKTEIKETKNGKGRYVLTEYVVLGPTYQSRRLFDRFNYHNESAEAQRIGMQQLKTMLAMSGMTQAQIDDFNDTDQMLGRSCVAVVDIQKSEEFGIQNRIKSYKKISTDGGAAGASMNLVKPSTPKADSFSEAFSAPEADPTGTETNWYK